MLNDLKQGAGANIPLAVSAIVYGGVLGVLSAQQQVSWAEMMAFMFAGVGAVWLVRTMGPG